MVTALRMRSQGMYNNYGAIHAFWSDTTDMDNLRGGGATPGSMKVDAQAHTSFGNTVHTYSGDTFCKPPKPPACIDWPSVPALLNPRIQECVFLADTQTSFIEIAIEAGILRSGKGSLADAYCIVTGVTWGTADDKLHPLPTSQPPASPCPVAIARPSC
jgi:hypothetical protein